ncbi:MAG: CapA family protein [Syntrophomonadaceae bacterium]|nr:CapA family protein [Syntrophomonadaceae bacterium]
MLRRLLIITVLITIGVSASLNLYAYTITDNIPEQKTIDNQAVIDRVETITLTAAGDCLMHNTQISSGLQADGSYRFDTFFTEVKGLIAEGDYSSTNFEAAMAGPESGYTGYPLFNSPDAVATAFKDAGFDLIVSANNHCLDRGAKGALRTLDVLRAAGLETLGTYKSAAECSEFLIKDIKGVKVAYLAYTYGTNGIPIAPRYSFLVNIMDKDKILADIKTIRAKADIVVLILHWGLEYNPLPSHEQKLQAKEYLEAGADVILGSHPHVIQTKEVLKVDNKEKFVIYSMGNFISHQIGQERNSGIVLKLKFTKDFASNQTVMDSMSYTPTFSHSYRENGRLKFRVVPVEETIRKIEAGQEPHMDTGYLPVLKAVLAATRNQLGESFIRK